MPKNSFLQALFSGPKFSLAPIEKNNRGSVKIGQIVPVWATVLNPREGVELNMSHLVRFLPAKAPVMEGYKVTFDAFAVPYSALGYAERKERDIDDFFNLKENGGAIQNPFCFPMSQLQNMLVIDTDRNGIEPEDCSLSHAFRKGYLGDYINFPSLKNVREHVRKWLLKYGLVGDASISVVSGSVRSDIINFIGSVFVNSDTVIDNDANQITIVPTVGSSDFGTARTFVPFSTDLSLGTSGSLSSRTDIFYEYSTDNAISGAAVRVLSLLGYILRNYPSVAEYFGFSEDIFTEDTFVSWYSYLDKLDSLDYLQVLYDNYKVDAQSIYDEYFEYVMSVLLYNPVITNYVHDRLYSFAGQGEVQEVGTFLPSLSYEEPIDLSLLSAYWKIISDWYINTNIDGDPDEFFLGHCNILTDSEYSTRPPRYVDLKPFVRRWPNDIFTSAVPMAQVQNIRIPADGTIPDLRDANAMQKLQDILRNTGSRLRDVQFGIRGIRASAVRSEMSEPIATKSSWVGFQSVLQTSQTTPDSPQAAYSGIGTDSSSGFDRFFKYINNAEPTPVVIMVLMSVSQRSAYMQGFDRSFFRKSIYDFAIPQLAMIGEQEVTNKELYFDKEYEPGIFGFNRRYYDWFYSGSEVHGDLRDSMDYWHGARIFDEQPALNSEFIGIEADKDHLQRIFANVSESALPIIYNISFDGYATRALPRYIQYEL